jgi:hypothetical protein
VVDEDVGCEVVVGAAARDRLGTLLVPTVVVLAPGAGAATCVDPLTG